MNAKTTFTFSLLAFVFVACGGTSDSLTGGRGPGDKGGDPVNPTQDDDPALCTSKAYQGFDDRELVADRKVLRLGEERARMKPFSALSTEYARVLGAKPASVDGAGATFGQPPNRWFEEPQANAVALQTAFSVAFDGCLSYTADAAEFASAPDATSAATQCSAMARKFWSKTPMPEEIQACVDVAAVRSAPEPAARRRWAYACASVLTSAGFLAY